MKELSERPAVTAADSFIGEKLRVYECLPRQPGVVDPRSNADCVRHGVQPPVNPGCTGVRIAEERESLPNDHRDGPNGAAARERGSDHGPCVRRDRPITPQHLFLGDHEFRQLRANCWSHVAAILVDIDKSAPPLNHGAIGIPGKSFSR